MLHMIHGNAKGGIINKQEREDRMYDTDPVVQKKGVGDI